MGNRSRIARMRVRRRSISLETPSSMTTPPLGYFIREIVRDPQTSPRPAPQYRMRALNGPRAAHGAGVRLGLTCCPPKTLYEVSNAST